MYEYSNAPKYTNTDAPDTSVPKYAQPYEICSDTINMKTPGALVNVKKLFTYSNSVKTARCEPPPRDVSREHLRPRSAVHPDPRDSPRMPNHLQPGASTNTASGSAV